MSPWISQYNVSSNISMARTVGGCRGKTIGCMARPPLTNAVEINLFCDWWICVCSACSDGLFSSATTTWPRTAVILVFGITGMPPPRSRDEQIRQLKDSFVVTRVHLCIFTPIYHHVLVIIIAVLGYSASPLSHCVDLAKLWFPALMIHIFVCALHADKSATPHYQSPFLANLGYHRPSSASDTVAR